MMPRPFLYDFLRTISNRSMLLMVGVILLFSFAIIPMTTTTGFSQGSSGTPTIFYYLDNSGYHFLAFTYDQYGSPVSGASISFTLSSAMNYTRTGITNSSGLAFVTVNAPVANYTLDVEASSPIGGRSSSTAPLYNPPMGQAELTIGSGSPISLATDKADAYKRDLLIFCTGPYAAVPSSFSVYYTVTASPVAGLARGNMTLLGTLVSYYGIFKPDIPGGLNGTAIVSVALFAPNNETAVFTNRFTVSDLRPPQTRISGTDVASSFFSSLVSFFIPLVAIVGSYSSYGKDRLTGVLESVLARPVSRRGLVLSRFLSTLLAISLAVVASVGIVDAILNNVTGSFLSQDFVLAMIAALLAEVAAFSGIVFLLSHLVKSSAVLLGISIGLFVVLDFFWSLITYLLTALLGGTVGSAVYIQTTILANLANPAQFVSLVDTYMFGSSSGVLIQPADYGLTLPVLIVDGVSWAVAPFVAFLYLAMKRD